MRRPRRSPQSEGIKAVGEVTLAGAISPALNRFPCACSSDPARCKPTRILAVRPKDDRLGAKPATPLLSLCTLGGMTRPSEASAKENPAARVPLPVRRGSGPESSHHEERVGAAGDNTAASASWLAAKENPAEPCRAAAGFRPLFVSVGGTERLGPPRQRAPAVPCSVIKPSAIGGCPHSGALPEGVPGQRLTAA